MPESAAIVLFLVLPLALHVWLFLQSGRELRKGGIKDLTNVLIIALTGLDALAIGVIVLLSCLFERRGVMCVLYILAGVLAVWLVLDLLRHRLRGKRLLVWLLCFLTVAGAAGGVLGREAWLRHITLREEFDYRSYLPFREDSLVQKLDEPAALRFSEGDRLPRMDGATALFPVYAAFCQAVYPASVAEGEGASVYDVINCSTTSRAYRKIVDGDCEIIFAAGPSEEQEAYAAEKGVELVYTPIGREAFVFFVHPKNPIESLSLGQIRDIYAGKTSDWDQLGVEGLGKILAYQRDEGSGSQTALERFVMRDTPLMTPDKEEVVDAMGGIIEKVSAYQNHKNAIGFSFRFYSTVLMKGFDVKLLQIGGVAPSLENIENGSYPLASSFYAVTRSDADENTLALLDWILSEEGQALVEKSGYTPIGAGRQP